MSLVELFKLCFQSKNKRKMEREYLMKEKQTLKIS